jgi:mycothione reductase
VAESRSPDTTRVAFSLPRFLAPGVSPTKQYGVVAIGTGSVMSVVDAMLGRNPGLKAAVIDKDEPGGICLTRGCIPTKILLYSAEVVRVMERAKEFGIDVPPPQVRFRDVMERMRKLIDKDIDGIRNGLRQSPQIDYYPAPAEFVEPYTLRIGGDTLRGRVILLGAGSQPIIPAVPGLSEAGFQTSDTVLRLTRLPPSIAVIGGGYIAAEYGHFFAAMGSQVTILGRNPQFLPGEEPEISAVARGALEHHLVIRTNQEVREVRGSPGRSKTVVSSNRATGELLETEASEILVAAGRGPTTALLHPERAGIETDPAGWIRADDHLRASQPNVWVIGDATGHFPFKHKANYDAKVVYENLVLGRDTPTDYRAVPHAVFTYPEVASVGLREADAVRTLGKGRVLIGRYRYQDTAKGEAMGVTDYFVKVIVDREDLAIVGAHIVGPYASMLIQEIVNLMYTSNRSARPILDGMHIHPALTEVVERAFLSLAPLEEHVHEHAPTGGAVAAPG